MATTLMPLHDALNFKYIRDRRIYKQNIAGFASVVFLYLGYIFYKKFGFSELALLPFGLCVLLTGFFMIESQIVPHGFVIYTKEHAQRLGFLYVLLGLFITVLSILGSYLGIFHKW